MKKIVISLVLVICIMVFSVAVGYLFDRDITHAPEEKPQNEVGHRTLVIVGEEWPPFESTNEGAVQGLDVEVLTTIFDRLKIPWTMKLYPWARASMMAEKGEADAVVSVSYKKSRESFLSYTEDQKEFGRSGAWPEHFLWSSEYLFFCKKTFADKIQFTSYDQIRRDGYRVGTVHGYSYNPDFRECKLSSYVAPDISTGFKLLHEGKYDLFPADKTVGYAVLKSLGLAEELVSLPKVMFRKPYLMPFCTNSDYPDKQKTMHAVYDELLSMRKSGEYKAIWEKYIK